MMHFLTNAINFKEKFSKFSQYWTPKILAQFDLHALDSLTTEELAKAYQEANAEIDHDFDTCSGDGLGLRIRKSRPLCSNKRNLKRS